MTPPQTTSLAATRTFGVEFQSQLSVLGNRFKSLGSIAVEGIFKKRSRFTEKELEEAREACRRG